MNLVEALFVRWLEKQPGVYRNEQGELCVNGATMKAADLEKIMNDGFDELKEVVNPKPEEV